MADRSHLSIGEVLSLLREEFPDVTISKIRFLESQGLVDPERTPSGYRKFYDHDVERLRWILRQQREHFLPLKVIRGRLSERTGVDGSGSEPDPDVASQLLAEEPAASPGAPAPPVRSEMATSADTASPVQQTATTWADRSAGRPTGTPSLFASLHNGASVGSERSDVAPQPPPERTMTANEAAPEAPMTPGGGAAHSLPGADPVRAPSGQPSRSDEPETYTADELARAAGADATLVSDLKQYGLIAPHAVVAGTQYYDAGAVSVARAAVRFARHGVEARHLRIWRNASDREADLFQQVVLPLLRQRNPQARRQALDTLAELSGAGADLRAALVERALRDIR